MNTSGDLRRSRLPHGLTEHFGGAKIYLKRDDLNHTGAHKINNAIGQILLARRMGKTRIIAETGAGQHGVATATVCALFGLECVVYMGTEDMRRQALNVFRMQLLGAEVRGVDSGSKTLKDAINEALRDWVTNVGRHALSAWFGAGAASVSDDGARFSKRHRQRSARADFGEGREAARLFGRLRRRRQQCDRLVLRISERAEHQDDRRRSGRLWHASRANTRRVF